MKYAFIAEHAPDYPVERQCQVLGVSVSGYYAWRQRQPSQQQQQDQRLLAHICAIYQASRCLYGSPRVHAALRRAGIHCSRKRVARLMRQAHLRSLRQRGRRVRTTDSKHPYPRAANLLQQDFQAQHPNQKWAADITYIPTDQGWLYLAVVLDLFARQVVGWAMGKRRDGALVEAALQMALTRRQPSAALLHHSDQGSQYAAQRYQAVLRRHGVSASMSRTGNCYDNAVMESFFRTLKSECVDLHHYPTRQQAQHSLFEFMEVYYNRQRLHSSLGYLSPVEFEALHPL